MKDGSVGTGGAHAGHSNVRENATDSAGHDKRGLSHESIDEVIRLDEAWRKARYDAINFEESATAPVELLPLRKRR